MYHRPVGPFTAAGLLTALLFAAWAYSPEPTPASNSLAETQCEARFTPQTIEIGTVHGEVSVTLTESIGDVTEVDTPEPSGLVILWLHSDDSDPEPSRVRVSALRANPGNWEVTVQGRDGSCPGTFTVIEGDRALDPGGEAG